MTAVRMSAICLLLLAAPAALAGPPTVNGAGIGAARIGMTVAEAEAALGVPLRPLRDSRATAGGCGFLYPEGLPGRYALLVVDGRLARVDVAARRVRTAAGLGVTSTELEIGNHFGDAVETRPHEHIPGGRYLDVPLADGLWLVFETNGEIVLGYRLGRLPEVRRRAACG